MKSVKAINSVAKNYVPSVAYEAISHPNNAEELPVPENSAKRLSTKDIVELAQLHDQGILTDEN
ncbi:MAG: hypothetical protein ABF966_03630 [Bifidobacterium psychraerophilum]|uniref:hypothetical protein n=1 Tax=Bifidobacterium psychraerophilum TaxID=218140 RepID=UPI0039E8B1D3